MNFGQGHIVVGPSRTGTSITMGLMITMGIYGGPMFQKVGRRHNPNNYENDLLHRYLFLNTGTPRDVVRALDCSPFWGMKHPFLALRWDEFKDEIWEPKFIVTRRPKPTTIESQMASNNKGRSEEELADEYDRIYEAIDEFAEPRIDVFFDRWFEEPCVQINVLANFIKKKVTQRAKNLVRPELKHF